ncbi:MULTISPECIES: galactokinase [Primorskyibacter]|uniref:Galactokinase n=1 Tax=Primorskyibacter flagellatus TaxID=1387277 RepID=A0A1W2EMG2_9RHOB|nr:MULTISPECIES: galactokinase [Primorskyibacter]SMD10328.1 galactokinase [Primorskyibacter flagellatus]
MIDNAANILLARVAEAYKAHFGIPPEAVAFAPGRVNLLGEHTDYNGGLVLPMPLRLGTAMAAGQGGTAGKLRVASADFESEEVRDLCENASDAWSDYVLGSFRNAPGLKEGSGLTAMVVSNLPMGAGLSSSAAIEVCTLRTADILFGTETDPVTVAKLARKVENEFVGMPCGIMDQFAVSVGEVAQAVFLDTRTLHHEPVPLPEGYSFLVVHSGASHKLTDGGYATRVAECQAACKALGVEALSNLDLDDMERIEALDEPLNRRARHIVTENDRVKRGAKTLEAGDAAAFANLMIASHHSQSADYAVSLPEIDRLVDGALAAGAIGARLTGGGFGGSIVVLVAAERLGDVRDTLTKNFPMVRVLTAA